MSVIEKLDSVLALMLADKGLITIRDYLVTGDFLRDNGPAIRQAMVDAERYAWLKEGENDSEVLEFNTHGNAGPDDVWLPRGDALDAAIDAARANRLAHYAAIDARLASDSEGGNQNG